MVLRARHLAAIAVAAVLLAPAAAALVATQTRCVHGTFGALTLEGYTLHGIHQCGAGTAGFVSLQIPGRPLLRATCSGEQACLSGPLLVAASPGACALLIVHTRGAYTSATNLERTCVG